jgi:integrase
MLLARVGGGSIEAARLQLDDLDWRAGRSVLRGKASRERGMPLPADVGEASSASLRQTPQRPASRQGGVRPCRFGHRH